MSKEIDALIIIAHSHVISQEPSHDAREDIDQSLWHVRQGTANWHNGQPISDEARENLFAGEILMRLGNLAARRYAQLVPEWLNEYNPATQSTLDAIDAISPLEPGQVLSAELAIEWGDVSLTERGLPRMFDAILTGDPPVEAELTEKWGVAQTIHNRRGKVAIMAYDFSELSEGINGLNMDEIAPDVVEFDDEQRLASQSYDLSQLVGRTGVSSRLVEVSYYQTCSDSEMNLSEMLTNALEDLRAVSVGIRHL